MIRMSCLYILILFAGSAHAQIASIIVDRATNNPLSKASISLQNITDSVIIKTVTADSGYFSFNNIADGHYLLTVSYIGYNEYSVGVEISNRTTNVLLDTIQLNKEDKDLNQIVVTGKKTFIEFNANQITLNVAQSPVATNGNVYDVIKRAPGVTENMNGLTFRNKPTLILINGKQTYLTGSELKQMLSDMPASNVDKIEIVPNPSAKYDANAQSVINIVLAKNNSYGLNGVVTGAIGAGNDARYNGGISLNYRKNKINVYGNYNYEHNTQLFDMQSDRALTATDHIMENNTEKRIRYNNDYKLGTDYTISKNSAAGILFTGYTNFRSRTSKDSIMLTHALPVADSFSTVSMNGRAIFSDVSINAYYKTTFDTSGKNLTLNADYFNYKKHWTDNYSTNYYTVDKIQYQPPYLLRDSSPGNNNVYSFAADYSNPVKNGRIDCGLKATNTKTDNNAIWQYQNGTNWLVDTNQTNHFIYTESIAAGYISFDKTIGKYEFIIGLRGEETVTRGNLVTKNQAHDSSYFGFFPNVLIQYSKNENNIFSIGYHKTIQRPDFDMINPFIIYISRYSFFAGNPYIKPEIDNTVSLTYTYKKLLNLAVSYSHATDDITALVATGANNSVGIISGNINKADMVNLSASWGGTILKFWSFNISSELGYLKYNNEDEKSDGLNSGNNGLIYLGQVENTFKFNKGWAAELGANYHSTIPSGVYVARPSFGSDMGIQKIVLHDKGKLTLSLTDIFNTEANNYSTNFMGINEKVKYKAESRFIKLQFSYKFGKKSVKQEAARPSAIADINKRMKS
jgi:iron complex outermembrane receptor protein